MPLAVARIKSGLNITVKEAKEVLAACNVFLPGQPSKAVVYRALLEQFVQGEDEIQQALALSNAKTGEDEEEGVDDDKLSEYQDLLDLVEEDTENRNDPDIKAEQQKLKQKRQKTAIAGHIMLGAENQRGRGRGRGKGKGKGRGRGGRGEGGEKRLQGNLPRTAVKQRKQPSLLHPHQHP